MARRRWTSTRRQARISHSRDHTSSCPDLTELTHVRAGEHARRHCGRVDCLSALSRQQEVLRGGVHGEDTAWMELINAGAGLQRNYMWTMEQARTLAAELGEETAARLEMLVLEQQDDSEAMDS